MNYIILDWTVSDICRRKEKFCFFVFLTLWDKEISRQIGRFDSVEQAEDAKAAAIEELQQKNFAVYGQLRLPLHYSSIRKTEDGESDESAYSEYVSKGIQVLTSCCKEPKNSFVNVHKICREKWLYRI